MRCSSHHRTRLSGEVGNGSSYGLGGVVSPFVGIKLIDLALAATGIV